MAEITAADKEGIIFVAQDSKGKKPKPFLLRLYGSSLYAYRLRPEGKTGSAVKWCIQLNDAVVDEKRGADSFAITFFNKTYIFMAAPDASLSKKKSSPSEGHPAEWLPFIKAGMHREPFHLPKDKGIAFRTKKGIMSSAMGQSIVSRVLDKRAKNILKAVRKVISLMYGSKYAEALEKKMIKLIVLSYFHYESGKLDQEGIASIESYLRRALKTVLIVVVNFHKIPNEAQRTEIVKERLEEVISHMNDMTSVSNRSMWIFFFFAVADTKMISFTEGYWSHFVKRKNCSGSMRYTRRFPI
eukprot:TRINITY_DN4067_c0_g2_i1.p1 TRINITY_DN4067_c0_g2~~TRINITY_DN4067_c0_g2_i1.p1  ORF type:complete len:299 (-),score=46.95 TRINITY_DN4067_c0_g2_i1:270-1166(-)